MLISSRRRPAIQSALGRVAAVGLDHEQEVHAMAKLTVTGRGRAINRAITLAITLASLTVGGTFWIPEPGERLFAPAWPVNPAA